MLKYKPQTKFQLSEDGDLVYNLHQDGWEGGEPLMVNDCYIHIQGDLTNEVKLEIMEIIKQTLNKEYFNKDLKNGSTESLLVYR